jgi:FAD/FMN-containing dehydrogenase
MGAVEAQGFEGELLLRGEDGYARAREDSLANRRRPSRHPEAIVRARSAADVVAAVRLARARGWQVDVRSGGHSWSGSHLHDGGLLIDVAAMQAFEIDAAARTAVAEPGIPGSKLAAALAERDLFFPTGHCIGPALGGYLLQGGFGWNSRVLGPACMSVTAVEAVTMDGEHVVADADENPELYWAARGAGPGFPAIVTRFHLALAPRPAAQIGSAYLFDIDALDELMTWAHEVSPRVPTSIEMMIFIGRHISGGGEPGLQLVAPVLAESEEQALADLALIESCPLIGRALAKVERQATDVGELTAGSALIYPEEHRYAVDNMWTSAAAADLLPSYRRVAETIPAAPTHMLWMNWAPAAGPERPEMAYSVEDDVYLALYGVWKDADEDEAAASWATERVREMEHLGSGIQLADENLAHRPGRFLTAAKLQRLEAVRRTYDPEGLLAAYNTKQPDSWD